MSDENPDVPADELSDELAKKYDPERLLKIMSKRAGRGERLDQSIRAKYERRFGVDLGHVRVYTGEFAEEFNKQRSAYAVTIGATGMILMGNSPDRSMGSASGQALLAHELTHVAQAKAGMHRAGKQGMPFAEEHEQEAEAVEAEVLAGGDGGGEPTGADQMHAESAAKDSAKATMKKVKDRVIEMAGEAARDFMMRNGEPLRRP